jgi:anti-sigma regulatory factor (Ser/Thr protein kinase)
MQASQRTRIDAMTTRTRPTELRQRRVRLTRKPAAAAEARSQVRAVIRAWEVPVDPDIAVLLTSDLVTYAITHWDSETVTLAVRCSRGQLRIDIYDASLPLPVAVDEQAAADTRSVLALVATLPAEWGSFLTFTGKTMYFALAFQAGESRLMP